MKRTLLSVVALLATASLALAQLPRIEKAPATSSSKSTMIGATAPELVNPNSFGYAIRDIFDPQQALGARDNMFVGAVIAVPTVAGAKITGVDYLSLCAKAQGSIGVFEVTKAPDNEGKQETKCIALKTVDNKKGAYSHAKFDTPIVMEEGKRYLVGYEVQSGTQAAGELYILCFDGFPSKAAAAMASYVSVGNNAMFKKDEAVTFFDISKENFGSPFLFVQIEGADEYNNAAIFTKLTSPGTVQHDQEVAIKAEVYNVSQAPITKIECAYTVDGTAKTLSLDNLNVAPGKGTEIEIRLGTLPIGTHKVEMAVNKLNDGKNNLMSDFAKGKVELLSMDPTQYFATKEILLERFTTEQCGYCPQMDPVQNAGVQALEGKGYKVSVIAHHVGFGTDFLTCSESEELLPYFYGGPRTFAPAISLNRAVSKNTEMTAPLIVGIGSSNDILNAGSEVGDVLTPARIKEIRRTLDWGGGSDYEVDIELSDALPKDNLYISAVLTENDIKAKSQASGGSNYKHHHVARFFAFGAFGQKIEVTGNTMTIPVKGVAVAKSWKFENCKLVVFLHRDIKNDEPGKRAIYSVMSIPANIKALSADLAPELVPVAYAIQNDIYIRGAVDSYEVYDLAGRRVASSNLAAGVYFVKVLVAGKAYTSKVIVK